MSFEKTIYSFLFELDNFNYDLSVSELVWRLIFPDTKGKWYYIQVTKYKQNYYINHIDGNSCPLEVKPGKIIKKIETFNSSTYDIGDGDLADTWLPIFISAIKWIGFVRKDWIKANKHVLDFYPLNRRFGVVPNSFVRESLPDIYRIDRELGRIKCKKFIDIVESDYFCREENMITRSMTANDYFKYCKIACIAANRKEDRVNKDLSGRQMYKRYADGRHEGLLDIDGNSKQEFSDWIDGKHPLKNVGGHPWEIKRGGNTTHIDLSVYRPSSHLKKGFKIELNGAAISRLKETIQMFLAIYAASLPISINNPEGIRKRLCAQDNIGIVPSYCSLHRANQYFKKDQDVYDVIYYKDLGRYKRRITPFISWEPLPILKPKCI